MFSSAVPHNMDGLAQALSLDVEAPEMQWIRMSHVRTMHKLERRMPSIGKLASMSDSGGAWPNS